MQVSTWVAALEREYLRGFIPQGGAAVKFAVPASPEIATGTLTAARAASERLGFHAITIDARELRVHMVDRVFSHIASTMPWTDLSVRVIKQLLVDIGYDDIRAGEGSIVDQLAEGNGVDSRLLMMELRRVVTREVYKRHELSKDFRVAMTQLILAHLSSSDAAVISGALERWMTNQLDSIAEVKPYHIYNRITRYNARHLLESLFHWVRFAGLPGTVLLMDISRLAVSRNPRDGYLFYTKAGVLDAYEFLRQCIDSIDKVTGVLIIVVADPSFLSESDPRSVHSYGVLRARMIDEVRDRTLENPLASLVRVASH